MIISMSELVAIATILGTILTSVCIYIAVQETLAIKCLKEISKDMKAHMRQLHEEHREIFATSKESLEVTKQALEVSKQSLEVSKQSLEVSKKILTAVTSK
ncbi:MAG: hypothetical protein AB1485_02795 [Candidatus Thermoplasmatota archaeon]